MSSKSVGIKNLFITISGTNTLDQTILDLVWISMKSTQELTEPVRV